jgi:hypothetical protein
MLPPQVKSTVDRFRYFIALTGDETKDQVAWNGLKQELGQLQWRLDAENVKGGGRVTSKSASARASGATEECINPENNVRAVRAYIVLCKLDNYRRASECKWRDTDGKMQIDTEIRFGIEALPHAVREYLTAFCAVEAPTNK